METKQQPGTQTSPCDDLLPPPAGSQHRKNGIFTACYSAQCSVQYSVQCTVGDTVGALGNGVFTGWGRGWGRRKISGTCTRVVFWADPPSGRPKNAIRVQVPGRPSTPLKPHPAVKSGRGGFFVTLHKNRPVNPIVRPCPQIARYR